jgi:hypothetical protein
MPLSSNLLHLLLTHPAVQSPSRLSLPRALALVLLGVDAGGLHGHDSTAGGAGGRDACLVAGAVAVLELLGREEERREGGGASRATVSIPWEFNGGWMEKATEGQRRKQS